MKSKQSFDRTLQLFTLLLVLGLGASPSAFAGLFEEAQEESGPATASGAGETAPTTTVELNGYLRGDIYLGKVPDKDVTEIKNGFGEVAAQLEVKMRDWGSGFGEIRLRQGYDGGSVSGAFDLREAYANLYLGPFDIRFGHQIIVWGRADAFNPTDNLTPRDMRVRSPNEDDRRAGNLALRTTINLQPVRWELIYVPFYAPAHFPPFNLPGPLAFEEPDYPDTDFEHGILATRANVELARVDFSVSYLFGYSTFPGLGLSAFTFGAPPEVALQFRAYQHHVVGADFSTTVGDWFGLRGEAALRWPLERGDGEHVPLPDIQYVLGFDREFGDGSLIVQYTGRTVLEWEELASTGLLDLAEGRTPTPEQLQLIMADPLAAARIEIQRKTRMIANQTEQYSHGLTARLAWKLFQETLTLEALGYYNFSTGEWMAVPRATYSIADGLTLTVGAEIYGGPDETLFGTIDEIMSAGFVELKAWF